MEKGIELEMTKMIKQIVEDNLRFTKDWLLMDNQKYRVTSILTYFEKRQLLFKSDGQNGNMEFSP